MRNRALAALLWTAVAFQVVLVPLGILFDALNRPSSSLGTDFTIDAVAGAASVLALQPAHSSVWLKPAGVGRSAGRRTR